MQHKKFFVLGNPCSADNVPTMIGRVVGDIYEPLNECAPWQQDARKILEAILPVPQVSTQRKECLEFASSPGAYAKLSKFLRIDGERQSKDSTTLTSDMIKQYTLENPAKHFQALMQNSLYATDVSELLREKHGHRGYLITGFLTATNSVWESNQSVNKKNHVGVTVPVAEALGVPVPVLDVGVGVSFGDKKTHHSSKAVADEEIFAVAYNVVHLKRTKMGFDSARKPIVGDIVWAKKKHAALSPDKARQTSNTQDTDDESEDGNDGEESDLEEIMLDSETEPLTGAFDDVLEMPYHDTDISKLDMEPEAHN